MNLAFSYERNASGRDFLGRRQDCQRLGQLLSEGKNVALYAPPKEGKCSLVEETLRELKQAGTAVQLCWVDAGNVLHLEEFFVRVGAALTKSLCRTPEQVQQLNRALEAALQAQDYASLFLLPHQLSSSPCVIVLKEFQRLEALDEFYPLLRVLKPVLDQLRGSGVSYLFMGSQVNAMKELFVKSSFFGDLVQPLTLSRISSEEIHNYIRSVLNVSGKVMERKDIMDTIALFDNNIWHIKHFMGLCDSLTRGYINEMVIENALKGLVSSQLPYLNYVATHLTCFQLRFLKAMIDEGKDCNFSSSRVLQKYGLNSSANVVRLRQALMKKEIITQEGKSLYIIDPLFHYWLKKYFFQ